MFTACEFCNDSIICGSHLGKIFCYSLYDYKLKYMIESSYLSHVKQTYSFENYGKES